MVKNKGKESPGKNLDYILHDLNAKKIVGSVKILDCVAENGLYKSKVNIQFEGVEAKKIKTYLINNPKTKEFHLSLEDETGKIRTYPLGAGPWIDPTIHNMISDMRKKVT